jgi:PadR family transcriptional regulator, regulatory protein PadR
MATTTVSEAKKGSAELVVLAMLEDGPRHGYDLASEIAERSEGRLAYNLASLYATVYKLEERGWIQGRWVERAGERRRRYYRITAAGRRVLGAQRDDWRRFVEALDRVARIGYA